MSLITNIFIVLICFSSSGFGYEIESYSKELIALGERDKKRQTDYVYWDEAIKIEKLIVSDFKVLIKTHGFPTLLKVSKRAHIAAFLIAQHAGNDLVFMKFYLKDMEKRLATGEVIDKFYAYLFDRISEIQGKKQLYGTQGECFNGEYVVYPVQHPEKLGDLRAEIGLQPLVEFSKQACIED